MRSTWRLIGLSAVLAAALTASPAIAVEDTDTLKKSDIAALDAQIGRAIAAIQELQGLKKDLKDLREDLTYHKAVTIPSMEQEIRDLQQQVVKLNQELARLRTSAAGRTSFYAGPGPNVPTGIIKLHNAYVEPVTITINNQPYNIPAGSDLSLNNQPAGEFVYEVVGIQQPVRRTLAANKTFDINVFPR
jgi:cell division protein ZapA (FtsZ GTPase activity inhibitor)